MICNKKNCGYQELVDGVVSQDRIRNNFVELLERSESSDIGIFLVLTYIIVKGVQKIRIFMLMKFLLWMKTERKPVLYLCVKITSAFV